MTNEERVKYYTQQVAESMFLHEHLLNMSAEIFEAVRLIKTSLQVAGKLVICGNGGSAADAQHIASEFVGIGHPAIALTADSAVVTAIGNDFGYSSLFTGQFRALLRPRDTLMVLSTSGRSENIVNAVREAARQALSTIALLGRYTQHCFEHADCIVSVPSMNTQRVQEMHKFIGHMIFEIIRKEL